jgi:AraC-like DNA-binding protein
VLLLALTCERMRALDEHLVNMLLSGDLTGALRVGLERLERATPGADPHRYSELGRMLGRALLAADRAEDAEELFQRLPKAYEALSRSSVRWHASLDQGALSLHLGRLGRAAEAWNLVADDESAPVDLRLEAMAGMATVVFRLGEHRRAALTLREAVRLAEEAGLSGLRDMVAALEVELAARSRLVSAEGMSDYALHFSETRADADTVESVAEELRTQVQLMERCPLVARNLDALRLLLTGEVRHSVGRSRLGAELRWLRDAGYHALEADLRLDAAVALLARDDAAGATEVLGAMARGEQSRGQRHAVELLYCQSRVQAIGGRHGDALRSYKEYARESLYRTMRERALVPRSRFVERAIEAEQGDAAMFRLPLRYRRAYRYIIERLADSSLSIRQVAAHINVTERALQAAFRKYLGMTPAELIRHRRMQGIRNDLREGTGNAGVLDTAVRWGMANRSTLAHSYRQQFSETPTATLRGAA